jgi:arginine exporter protein ArgO
MSPIVKKIIGFFLIALAVIVAIVLIKKLPPVMKLIALAADLFTIFIAVNLIKSKNKKEKDEKIK